MHVQKVGTPAAAPTARPIAISRRCTNNYASWYTRLPVVQRPCVFAIRSAERQQPEHEAPSVRHRARDARTATKRESARCPRNRADPSNGFLFFPCKEKLSDGLIRGKQGAQPRLYREEREAPRPGRRRTRQRHRTGRSCPASRARRRSPRGRRPPPSWFVAGRFLLRTTSPSSSDGALTLVLLCFTCGSPLFYCLSFSGKRYTASFPLARRNFLSLRQQKAAMKPLGAGAIERRAAAGPTAAVR